MFGLTGKEIYEYGTYVFILWVAQFLVRNMWNLFKGKVKDIYDNTTENKRLNVEITKNLKDGSVIQAQTLDKIEKHDKSSSEAWGKVLNGLDRICEFLNGKNPAIAKIQAEMKELKEKIK